MRISEFLARWTVSGMNAVRDLSEHLDRRNPEGPLVKEGDLMKLVVTALFVVLTVGIGRVSGQERQGSLWFTAIEKGHQR